MAFTKLLHLRSRISETSNPFSDAGLSGNTPLLRSTSVFLVDLHAAEPETVKRYDQTMVELSVIYLLGDASIARAYVRPLKSLSKSQG